MFDFYANLCPHLCIEVQIHLSGTDVLSIGFISCIVFIFCLLYFKQFNLESHQELTSSEIYTEELFIMIIIALGLDVLFLRKCCHTKNN